MDVKNFSAPFFVLLNGVFHDANDAFLNMVRYTWEELSQKEFSSIIVPSCSQNIDLEIILNEDNHRDIEIEILSGNQDEKWLHIFAEHSFEEKEHMIWCIAYDITKQKERVEELEMREVQYINILDNMSEAVIREGSDGLITYANNTFCSYHGINPKEVTGMDGESVVIDEDVWKYDELHETLTPDNPFYQIDCRVKKANGQIAWVECTGKGFFNRKGKLIECQEVYRDITELKKKQETLIKKKDELEISVNEKTKDLYKLNKELLTTNHYLNSILQNICEGVAVVDEFGNLEKINASLEQSWGSALPELTEKLRKNIMNELQSPLRRMIREKKAFSNLEMLLGDNRCLVSGAPIEDQVDEVRRGVIIIQPYTKVHQLVNQLSGFQARFDFSDIISNSSVMFQLIQYAKEIANSEANVLIEGESGTGKELFAQAIHNGSGRKEGPFIAVNCGAIPSELIESELFGYCDGTFTGAKRGGKPGKFELASGGTVFLDEIGDMPLVQQVALLRVIQEKNVLRIGGEKVIPVDVRIICATNKDLFQEVKLGNFRQDLYYRLNVIHLKIPSLRERIEDIPLLVKYFIEKLKSADKQCALSIDDEIVHKFSNYDWPGNVRELQNAVERLIYITDGQGIKFQHLPDILRNKLYYKSVDIQSDTSPNSNQEDLIQLKEKQNLIFERQEKSQIVSLLDLYENNISLVARKMNISRNTLYRKLKKYNLNNV